MNKFLFFSFILVLLLLLLLLSFASSQEACGDNFAGDASNCIYQCYARDETNPSAVSTCNSINQESYPGSVCQNNIDICFWRDRCDLNEQGTRACSSINNQAECENSYFKNGEDTTFYNRLGEVGKYYKCQWASSLNHCRIWRCNTPTCSDTNYQMDECIPDCPDIDKLSCDGLIRVAQSWSQRYNPITGKCEDDVFKQETRECSSFCLGACVGDNDCPEDKVLGCIGPKLQTEDFFCKSSDIFPNDFTCDCESTEKTECNHEPCNAECENNDDCPEGLVLLPEFCIGAKLAQQFRINDGLCDLDNCQCGGDEFSEIYCVRGKCGAECDGRDGDLCDLSTCKLKKCADYTQEYVNSLCINEDDAEKPFDANPCLNRASCDGSVSVWNDESINNIDVNSEDLERKFRVVISGVNEIEKPADIMIVFDKSYSIDNIDIDNEKTSLQSIYSYIKSSQKNEHSYKMGLTTFNHDKQSNAFLDYLSNSNLIYEDYKSCGCTSIASGLLNAVENFEDSSLSCNDESVNKKIILFTNDEENRIPTIQALKNSLDFERFSDVSVNVIAMPPATSGYDVSGTAGWEDDLIDLTTWGRGGIYKKISLSSQLFSSMQDIFFNKIKEIENSAYSADGQIIISDKFDLIRFENLQGVLASSIGNQVDFSIGEIAKGEVISFDVVVKLKDGVIITGESEEVDVIDIINSYADVTNTCGDERISLNPVKTTLYKVEPPQPIFNEAFWARDGTEERITSAEIGQKVRLIWKNSDLIAGENIEFNIKEYDPTFFNADEDITTLTTTSEDKIVSIDWVVDRSAFNIGDNVNEDYLEFYFEVSGTKSNNLGVQGVFDSNVYWADSNTELEIEDSLVGNNVKMILEGVSGNLNDEVIFEIYEKNTFLDDSIRVGANAITGKIVSAGKAVGEWIITLEDYNLAHGLLEGDTAEFYFKVNNIESLNLKILLPEDIAEWTCEKGEHYSEWIKGEQNLDTKLGQVSCAKEKFGSSADCCPTGVGWTCSVLEGKEGKVCIAPNNYVDVCENIRQCSNYLEEEKCNNDKELCRVGKSRVINLNLNSGVSEECNAIVSIEGTIIKSGCMWITNNDIGSCKQVTKQFFEGEETDIIYSCIHEFSFGECKDGFVSLISNQEMVWGNYFIEDLDIIKSCEDYLCPKGPTNLEPVSCRSIARLSFFNSFNFAVSLLAIGLFYLIYRRRFIKS